MPGLTQEQRDLIAQTRCEQGHRFDAINYPTPEGICPLCAYPDVREDIDRYQRLLAELPRASLHPSLTAM